MAYETIPSVRVPVELYDTLRKVKGKKSWAAFMRGIAEIHLQATYPCSVCKKRIYMYPNSPALKAAMNYLVAQGWGHGKCIDKKKKTQQST